MHTKDYIRDQTGLLLVDPYNDFLSPTGKLWPQAKEVAEEVNLLSNLKSIVGAARQSGVRIFVVPHHRWEPGDLLTKAFGPALLEMAPQEKEQDGQPIEQITKRYFSIGGGGVIGLGK